MSDPNTTSPQMPKDFEAVKITFKDGHTQYGYWNGSQWTSEQKRVETETILKWEPLPNQIRPA